MEISFPPANQPGAFTFPKCHAGCCGDTLQSEAHQGAIECGVCCKESVSAPQAEAGVQQAIEVWHAGFQKRLDELSTEVCEAVLNGVMLTKS